MKKPKLIIFGDRTRQHTDEAIEDFLVFARDRAEILAKCSCTECSLDILRQADFAVVFGGDGTILSAARQLCETSVPVVGVNVGKLGFLAEFALPELTGLFERVITDPSLTEKRMILECQICQEGAEKLIWTAVNDVVITAGEPFSLIELSIRVNNQPVAGCSGDGLIISTPTGSTAHNLSAGGPILSANLSAIVITPICPHSLSFRPIVIDASNIVEVEPVKVNRDTSVILDGQTAVNLAIGQTVKVQRHRGSFLVVNNPLRTQWDTLANKLSWAGKPCYNITDNKRKA